MRTVPTTASATMPSEESATMGDCHIIDRVPVIAFEDALLAAEDRAAKGGGAAPLPGLGGELDPVFGGEKGREGLEDHATSLRS